MFRTAEFERCFSCFVFQNFFINDNNLVEAVMRDPASCYLTVNQTVINSYVANHYCIPLSLGNDPQHAQHKCYDDNDQNQLHDA